MNEEHKREVRKLELLENDLVHLVSDTNDQNLMDKFLEWQDQRNKCNESILRCIDTILNK